VFWLLDGDKVRECSMDEWVEWFKDLDRRTVARDEVCNETISTVFSGLDAGNGPYFETRFREIYSRTYSLTDAQDNHVKIVKAALMLFREEKP